MINKMFNNGYIYWIVTVLMLVLILVGTLAPQNRIELPITGSDKSLHFVAFAALVSPLIFYNLKNSYWIVPLALGLGALIEVFQPIFGRHRDVSDFYADTLGVFFSLIVISTGKLIFHSK
ncbi:MAG: VanZ family protein [Paracoccaceae bacterium]|nr:VanZ family protein [Paracoccaceae bacterium]